MLPSKTKTRLMETPHKSTPTTTRVSKLGRTSSKSDADSHSPLQSSRLSIDRSPRSVESKPNVERRLPKLSTPPDKLAQVVKGADLQAQLNVALEDLKKAKNKLTSLEKEKAQTLEELNEAKRQADEATEKLSEVLVALNKAEEETEIERFRTIELEQAGLEAAQQKEDVWEKELETVRNQHALDVSALFTTTQELQRVQQELAMTTEAKNTALSHADDAMKIAEINAEKVEILSGEVTRLKSLIDSKMESKMNEDAEQVKKSESELNALKCELEKAMEAQKKLTEMEMLVEDLRIEVIDAKRAESDASNLVDEWKKKAELLEMKVVEAIKSEQSSSEALGSTIKQLEACNASLQDAVSEIACLKGKVESFELEVTRHKADLGESEHRLEMSKQEVLDMETTIEVLKSEIRNSEEEKIQALDNKKQIAASFQSLLEERDKILSELENSREEVEHSKKAMDGLASALHEVSTEARESKERLLTQQAEVTDAKDQIDELKQVIKSTEERYMAMLSVAKDEIVLLEADIDRSEMDAENSRIDWNRKEQSFVTSLKKSEEEVNLIKAQLDEVVGKLKGAELEEVAAKEESVQLLARIKDAEVEAATASEAAEKAIATSLRLKEVLLDKENELQNISQENDDLRMREETALKKIKELSKLLDEATAKKTVPNGKLTNDEKDSLALPNTLELSDDVEGESKKRKDKFDMLSEYEDVSREDHHTKEANGSNKEEEDEEEEPAEVDAKKTENYEVVDKGLSPERELELESLDDETDSKLDNESLQQIDGLSPDITKNGGSPPSKEKQQKKKKALLSKFGSLLKKKNTQK